MQETLFIVYDYLEFKRRKLGFFHRFSLKNKQRAVFACSCAYEAHTGAQEAHRSVKHCLMCKRSMACAQEAHGAASMCELLRFRLFFHLETPMNLKWIFITLYRLKKPSKNHWSSIIISLILYVMSWFVDFHDFSLQTTYRVAWFWIKVNYNDSSENNTVYSAKHWQLL